MTHDAIIRFLDNLDEKIKFHRENQHDPHNIGIAVMVALEEVRHAFARANHMEKYSKEVGARNSREP